MKKRTNLLSENCALKGRLAEMEELLAAIKSGSVDAFVTDDQKVFTLKTADRAYRVLVETISEGAATLQSDGTLMYCNNRLAIMLGLPMGKIVGGSLFDFVGPDEHRQLRSILCPSKDQTSRSEFRLKQKDGTLVPALISCNSLELDNASLCAVITDLTELKKAELELEVKNAQLRQLADTLFRVEADERKRLADLLHDDVQQILVACMMRLSIPHYSHKHHDEIHKLLDQAIEASRTLSAELRPPALFEKGLVAGVRWFIERNVKRLGLTIDIRTDGYEEISDQSINVMLYQCVRELIFNIIKHAHVSRAILTFATVKGESIIRVNDLGRGFVVADVRGRRDGEGGGFGSFSIRERLRAIGGKYTIESSPGKGTGVTLTIPWQKVKSFFPSDNGTTKSSPGLKSNIRILVVDDHKLVRQGIINALSAEKDISVIGQAENGLEAVSRVNELKPDIVVMDLNMPGMNGSEAAHILREKRSKVKIIIISVNADKQSERTVLEAGADAFLSKSSDVGELLRVIRACASR